MIHSLNRMREFVKEMERFNDYRCNELHECTAMTDESKRLIQLMSDDSSLINFKEKVWN